jgi:hypothetical protein
MAKLFFKKNRITSKKRISALLNVWTISIVLIAAFSLLGISYASWNQSLNLFGSISTGMISVAVRDVVLESSDSYETLTFDAEKSGNVVEHVNMEVKTEASPFDMVLVFAVENTGSVPVICEGIDTSAPGAMDIEFLDIPAWIDVGDSASIRVRIKKGFTENFEFSTFLNFVQKIG